MPTVPVYDRPQAELNQLRRPDPDGARFAGEAGRVRANQTTALAGALGSAAETFDRIELREANREAFEIDATMKEEYRKFRTELQKNRQGSGAKGVTTEVEKWWADSNAAFESKATNGRAKQMVKAAATRMREASIGEFTTFETNQLEVASTAAYNATILASARAAAANPATENIAFQQQAVTAAVTQRMKELGFDTAASHKIFEAEQVKALSAVNEAAFNTLFTQNPTAARDFFNANEKNFDPLRRNELRTRLKTGVAGVEGEEAAADAWAKHGPKKDIDAVELDVMEKTVREKFSGNPEASKAAISALRERTAAHNSSQNERTAARTNNVMEVWNKTSSMEAVKRTPEWSGLPATKQAELENYITGIQTSRISRAHAAEARADASMEREERRKKRAGFEAYLVYSQPQVLARMSEQEVRALLPTLGTELTTSLRELHSKYNNPSTKDEVISFEQQIAPYVGRKSPFAITAEKEGAFRIAANNEVAAFQKATKRAPTHDERQKILDRLVMQQDGGWFGSATRYFQTPNTPEDRAKFMEQAVPAQDRKEIIDGYKARGLPPPTVQQILDAYRIANPGKQQ